MVCSGTTGGNDRLTHSLAESQIAHLGKSAEHSRPCGFTCAFPLNPQGLRVVPKQGHVQHDKFNSPRKNSARWKRRQVLARATERATRQVRVNMAANNPLVSLLFDDSFSTSGTANVIQSFYSQKMNNNIAAVKAGLHKFYLPVRVQNYVEEVVPIYSAAEFKSHFRM